MPVKKTSYSEISYQTFLRFFLVLTGFVVLYLIRDVILAVLFAIVIASAIEPFIEWGRRYKFPRLLSVVIVYVVALAAIIGVIFLVVPLILNDLQGFLQSYATYQQKFLKEIEQLSNVPVAAFFSGGIADLFLAGASRLVGFSSNILGFTTFIFGGAASVIIILVVSFYLATQERGIENFLRLVSPLEDEDYIIDLWQRSQKKMGQWLMAQILLALLVGVLVYLALTIVGVKYSLILGLLAAAFEIVPVIGPVIAAAPAVFLAFFAKSGFGAVCGRHLLFYSADRVPFDCAGRDATCRGSQPHSCCGGTSGWGETRRRSRPVACRTFGISRG